MQYSQWKRPSSVLLAYNSVGHLDFFLEGPTINKKYYLELMSHMLVVLRSKRPDLRQNNSWFLHQDYATAHTSLLVRAFLDKNNIVFMPHSPYSPDLGPCDVFQILENSGKASVISLLYIRGRILWTKEILMNK